jgi:hypothetical protein
MTIEFKGLRVERNPIDAGSGAFFKRRRPGLM